MACNWTVDMGVSGHFLFKEPESGIESQYMFVCLLGLDVKYKCIIKKGLSTSKNWSHQAGK